jgi:toxin ParE1/3/4
MFPHSGAPRLGLGSDIRIGVVRPYVVIYRYLADDDIVTVLRVVHGRRRIIGSLLTRNA